MAITIWGCGNLLKLTGNIRNLFPKKIYRGPVQPAVGPYIWRLTFTGQRPGAHLHDTFTRKLDGQPRALAISHILVCGGTYCNIT